MRSWKKRVKIEEVVDTDDESVRCDVSRAVYSLEQEVYRSGRSVRQTTTYNPTTGKVAKISAVQN